MRRAARSGPRTHAAMAQRTSSRAPARGGAHDAGIGLISLLLGFTMLAVVAVVVVRSLDTTTKSLAGITTTSAIPNRGAPTTTPPGSLNVAADLVAQDDLVALIEQVDGAAIATGGYGFVDAQSLSGLVRGVSLADGASTSPTRVSFAAAGGASGGVTLAVRAASGNCWLVWRSALATRYGGAAPGAECLAPPLARAPIASTTIRWQSGSFPTL